ncbi:MAG: LpxI family protein [Desulfovibrio sp.]|uniref:LpxI family protein n=1 Tax=Desulfovibrio sp. 7SRBS1 TaxID=3378064 RepID=UPI003B422469
MDSTTSDIIGVIAGGGQFPRLVAQSARKMGHGVAMVGFYRNTDVETMQCADSSVELKLGQLSKLISYFKKHNVRRIVMAGTINKAKALDLRPDFRAAKLLFSLKGKGDDALLRAISSELEREGFVVSKAHEVVPELLTPAGILTRKQPSPENLQDIAYGWDVAKIIGQMDIGQTIVLKKQVVAAVEALEGTDAAIKRGAELAGDGCTVVKIFKPGQEERIDLPSFGLQTMEVLQKAGVECLAVEAGRSLFFNREESLDLADSCGICVVAVTPEFLSSIKVAK